MPWEYFLDHFRWAPGIDRTVQVMGLIIVGYVINACALGIFRNPNSKDGSYVLPLVILRLVSLVPWALAILLIIGLFSIMVWIFWGEAVYNLVVFWLTGKTSTPHDDIPWYIGR